MKRTGYSRRRFLKLSGIGLGSLPFASWAFGQRSNHTRPNVILVMTDDQGYGDLGCYGNPMVETPNLDALYRESVRLEDFHVSPTCSPTRAALLTGHYTNRTGAWHTIMGRSLLFEDEVTMANVFGDNGYHTGIFGKWHLGDNYPFRPQDRGFQEVLVNGGGGVQQTPDYWGNDYLDDVYFHNGTPRQFTGYCTDIWFDNAMQFIERNKNHPFFCYIPTNAAHHPFNVPAHYAEYYRKKGEENENRARFFGMIQNIDDNMARLEIKLKELGIRDNTILIFLTDNGTSAGGFNAGMRGHKGSAYEGGHRVPCFIRWPDGGIQGGKDVHEITAHIDILPTLIDLCGLPTPTGVKFDGTSLVPLLSKGNARWPKRVLITDSQRVEDPIKWKTSAVMTNQWRLINGKELYNMDEDPGQQHDVANQHPDVVKQLREAYNQWWDDISPRFTHYARIVVGSGHENPSRLTCHDWHTEDQVPWNQQYIRQAPESNGHWMLEVARPGEYEVALRRWPVEAEQPITAPIPGGKDVYDSEPMVTDPFADGKAIQAETAKIKIGDYTDSKPIPVGAKEIRFSMHLNKGPTQLQTWFDSQSGESRGAYYASVKRLS